MCVCVCVGILYDLDINVLLYWKDCRLLLQFFLFVFEYKHNIDDPKDVIPLDWDKLERTALVSQCLSDWFLYTGFPVSIHPF